MKQIYTTTLNQIKKAGHHYPIEPKLYHSTLDHTEESFYLYHNSYLKSFQKGKTHAPKISEKVEISVAYDYIYDHLKKQKEHDRTHLGKKKEILFLGKSNSGKSSLINALFNQKKANRVSKYSGCTKKLNYFDLLCHKGSIVDAPGYGHATMSPKSFKKLMNLVRKYYLESSRLCKIFWLVDLQQGLQTEDFQFLEAIRHTRIGLDLVYTQCDKVRLEDTVERALSLTKEVKKFDQVLSSIVHLTSSKVGLGLDSVRSAVMQSLMEAPTRKVVRKDGKLIYMLEDNMGVATEEEQKQYRLLVKQLKLDYNRGAGSSCQEYEPGHPGNLILYD